MSADYAARAVMAEQDLRKAAESSAWRLLEALEQALTDLKGVAADATPEAQAYVRETAGPRIEAALRCR